MRIDKLLANAGLGSRKDVKKLLKQGKVVVNDCFIKDPKQHVFPETDIIYVNNEPVIYKAFTYFMLNKPKGVISATKDDSQQTVLDLLDSKDRLPQLFPVGRLDKNTTGLLLITNDGQLAHRLLSPKHHVNKTYIAKIDGTVTQEDVQCFQKGIKLEDDYVTLPSKLEILTSASVSEVKITISEGKFHQIKRMFLAVGKKVIDLKRLTMGPLVLDQELKLGEYRPLTEEEIRKLFQL
ncbi:16S rRNA pseudouridine516 synthase [Scopulibacillus daqui]|uniref:Pseudouridine synthase n=1 Tax=Scopulibacillus daqui TaxID=1469162 RepID=A0ABS2Q2Z2_9BACL|nr:pseudouridine synthase [Scopulibacillus daqui]MBM7646491.1 16S rRNA pseudouridine516 synthase [Scopulibacillus daqui]